MADERHMEGKALSGEVAGDPGGAVMNITYGQRDWIITHVRLMGTLTPRLLECSERLATNLDALPGRQVREVCCALVDKAIEIEEFASLLRIEVQHWMNTQA